MIYSFGTLKLCILLYIAPHIKIIFCCWNQRLVAPAPLQTEVYPILLERLRRQAEPSHTWRNDDPQWLKTGMCTTCSPPHKGHLSAALLRHLRTLLFSGPGRWELLELSCSSNCICSIDIMSWRAEGSMEKRNVRSWQSQENQEDCQLRLHGHYGGWSTKKGLKQAQSVFLRPVGHREEYFYLLLWLCQKANTSQPYQVCTVACLRHTSKLFCWHMHVSHFAAEVSMDHQRTSPIIWKGY